MNKAKKFLYFFVMLFFLSLIVQNIFPNTTEAQTVTPPLPAGTQIGALNLPRIPWEGGPTYYSQFSKANAAGWSDPSFFPIAVFFGKPAHALILKSVGVNTFMVAENNDPISVATNVGIFVMAQQEEWTSAEIGTDPRVVSWFASDECDMGYSGCGEGALTEYQQLAIQQGYVNKIRSLNDGRFVSANFGNGVLQSFWSPNTMNQHVQLMDISGVDKYAYTSPGVQFELNRSPAWPAGANPKSSAAYGWLADQMRKFQDPLKYRPVWLTIETAMPYLFGSGPGGIEPGATTITPDQLEGAMWSAIIHEARGVTFFQHNNNGICDGYSLTDPNCPGLQAKVTAVTAKIRLLAPVINSQSYQYNFNNQTDTMLKTYGGYAYIFVDIGLLESPGQKSFTIPPGIGGTSVEVVGENRIIPVINNAFTDSFAAEYTHHVYKISLTTLGMPPTPTTKTGDLNNDNLVNIFDYNILVGNFGRTGSGIIGDIDANSTVNIFDYNLLVGNFGK